MKKDSPLSWTCRKNTILGGNLFPYSVTPNGVLHSQELKHITLWCEETYGPRFLSGYNDSPALWTYENYRDTFSFRREEDATMFIVAMSGLLIN